ncbi:MAG: hypothetical protein ACM3ZT_04765 [Bacillota bacterium]
MIPRVRMLTFLGLIVFAFGLPGCGSGSSDPSENNGGGGGSVTLPQRQAAAEATVKDDSQCTALTPFYWEIGDENGALDSGTGGDNSNTPPSSETTMAIASASKWIFGAYALEKLGVSASNPLTADEVEELNFTSGYDHMADSTCFLQDTVAGCFGASNPLGGLNSDRHTSDIGHFFYNGGHMQALAVNSLGLGGDYISFIAPTPKLATAIESYVGQDLTLYYSNPSLAGGVDTTPATYAAFLRKILNGDLRMKDYLSADAVCAHANSTDCPTAIYSPINQSAPGTSNNVSDEAWHYSLGHWIEDDPKNGDGAFSSPGADGFYPWIDASKTYYGVLARFDSDPGAKPGQEPYVLSVYCGRKIRKAWLTGQEQ